MPLPPRPDPDALLARAQSAERRAARGKLRIYFGASAGVGKTFAMLEAARRALAEGRDVAVGVIETHGRAETQALLDRTPPLPRIALRSVELMQRRLEEFDLDATLARHPALIIVDELAHSNLPGSRHPKRWQDVEELLDAGIDVYTALNVQHLESLNDVVAGITGIHVTETVPDTFFDAADEVIVVDLPAEELLKRLHEGRVYVPEQIQHATEHFFRRGNLMALRELALRRTADRIEADVQNFRTEKGIAGVWKTEAVLLCCVGPQPDAEDVVRAAARLATQMGTGWHAVYVETPRLQRLSSSERERILKVIRLAEDLGARAAILASGEEDISGRLIDYAREQNLSRMVLGRTSRVHRFSHALNQRLSQNAPDLDVIVLGHQPSTREETAPHLPPSMADPQKLRARRLRYARAVGLSALTTVVTLPLLQWLHPTNIAMLFLLSVALVAIREGRGPAILAAVINVVAFDFFFVPPRYSFAVADIQYLVTFLVMISVGILIAELTARLRYQLRVTAQREERAQALFAFARELASALRLEDAIEIANASISRTFRADAHVLLDDNSGELDLPDSVARAQGFEPAIAAWAFSHHRMAGLGTTTLPGSDWLYLPLNAPTRTRGVLALRARSRRLLLVPEQRRQLETFAALAAIVIERMHYVDTAQQALMGMESERLRNSLLSALSHDLRTPLTAVAGLSETLSLSQPPLSRDQRELAQAIHAEAGRMSALVNNLLDMARFESGAVRIRADWHFLDEVAATAIAATARQLAPRRIETQLSEDLPLIEFDPVLIERVFVNLLENAAKYTPPETTIRISAQVRAAQVVVAIDDNGPGLPAGREEALFAKFARGVEESATTGIGLGLAVCRAIIEAHGGRIWAEADPRGAHFRFSLPLSKSPTIEDDVRDLEAHV